LRDDPNAGESEISEYRTVYLTNVELFRVAIDNQLRRYIWSKDIELNKFILPQLKWNKKVKKNPGDKFINHDYTGKHLADCLEASIGAYLMSGGLHVSMQYLDKIGVVPL
jgi:dsRNA-specific ribonuclease